MNIVAIIPARGGSKELPGKNIKLLAGKPLIAYSIEQAKNSKLINKVVVSTEDKGIAEVAKRFGAEVIMRPAELATDTAPMEPVLRHVVKELSKKGYKADIIVLLQPTSPLRTVKTMDSAIKSFTNNIKKYDSLMPVKRVLIKRGKIINKCYVPERKVTRRQDLEEEYYECGTIFIFKSELIESKNIYGERIMPFIIDSDIEAIDIDSMGDFKIAEALIKNG